MTSTTNSMKKKDAPALCFTDLNNESERISSPIQPLSCRVSVSTVAKMAPPLYSLRRSPSLENSSSPPSSVKSVDTETMEFNSEAHYLILESKFFSECWTRKIWIGSWSNQNIPWFILMKSTWKYLPTARLRSTPSKAISDEHTMNSFSIKI